MSKLLIVLMWLILLAGCSQFQQTDEGLVLKPEAEQKIDDVAATAEATGLWLAALASLLGVPILSLVGGGVIAGAKVCRNMKPKLEAATTEADKYHDVAEVLIANIEDLKNSDPELWAKIQPFIAKQQVGNVLAVIKALRGE